MKTKTYVIRIDLGCVMASQEDQVAEYYGTFSYRYEGASSWIKLVETNDSFPWIVQEEDYKAILEPVHTINLPVSSEFIEVQASLKEYNPSTFEADEDLGTCTLLFPIDRRVMLNSQGNNSTGQAEWRVILIPRENYRYQG